MDPAGKHARIENERRFLLSAIGEDILMRPRRVILDHYISGTNLRLRQMENGDNKVYKLTKKTKLSPGREEITTIYLSLEEYELLSKLRATVVSKIRFIMPFKDIIIGIDSYATEEDELLIAEVEFETEEHMKTFVMPLPYDMEVTWNEEFNGFTLANRFGWQNRRF
jgi:CYTH domain-containing protein